MAKTWMTKANRCCRVDMMDGGRQVNPPPHPRPSGVPQTSMISSRERRLAIFISSPWNNNIFGPASPPCWVLMSLAELLARSWGGTEGEERERKGEREGRREAGRDRGTSRLAGTIGEREKEREGPSCGGREEEDED